MSTPQCMTNGKSATLHVFAQDDAWHWGVTVPRGEGGGFQVIAYNKMGFASETDATSDGNRVLRRIVDMSLAESGKVFEPPSLTADEKRRRYMRARLRCAMARLIACDKASKARAARWAATWGALIGEQYFDKALRRRRRNPDSGWSHTR